jgi:hypothetical protein
MTATKLDQPDATSTTMTSNSSRGLVVVVPAPDANDTTLPKTASLGCGDDVERRTDHDQDDAHGYNVGAVFDPSLVIWADALDDLEAVRIATENRVRSLEQVKGMAGGREHERMGQMVAGIAALEHAAELELQRAMRAHPLGPFVKSKVGLGEKQTARLLAAIGDPYWHSVYDRPRTVSELWAYCGMHVVTDGGVGAAPTRRRGTKVNWNMTARSRVWLVAQSCIKQTKEGRRSPYRDVYDDAKAKYADAVHERPCVRCGPSGKPAAVGSALSDGHKHARAQRLMSKAILRDLWVAARDLHDRPDAKPIATPMPGTRGSVVQ